MHYLQDAIIGLVNHYGYFGLFVGMTLGNIGAPVGAEFIMTIAGSLVATGHLSNLWLAIAAGVVGELTGATIGYAIGKFGGRPLVDRFGKYVHLTHENLDRVHAFFQRYGSFSIFVCRFIPVIRGIVSIPAGLADMALGPFYAWYALGSFIFCAGLVFIGNALGKHLDRIMPLIHKGGFVLLGIAIVAVVVAVIVARKHRTQVTPS